GQGGGDKFAAAGLSLCWTARAGKECRGLSGAGLAGLETGRRRWPVAPGVADKLSASAIPRHAGERRARRSLCLGGRFGVSEPDRYVRHGPARSARLRAAGGGAA